ncbi:MAG: glycosyltransferase, partial [Bdellovibrionales bacterium]|nr:glycosyltransferase [Bdellovibrionales bacterium]
MNVWLIKIGEPLPSRDGRTRPLRTGIMGRYLSRRGHDVTWWTGRFDHFAKKHLLAAGEVLTPEPRYRIVALDSPGYARNVSIQRLIDHRRVAAEFRRASAQEAAPDLIVCSMPTLELCREALDYARPRGIPVVVDLRDMWPDIFLSHLPRLVTPLARLAILPFRRQLRAICREATALTGITPEFVSWGSRQAGGRPGANDRAFWLGYSRAEQSGAQLGAATAEWARQGLDVSGAKFRVCYFGTLSGTLDLATAIEAARLEPSIEFVVCGAGQHLEKYREQARGLPNVRFPGWVDAVAIRSLMEISQMGLAPYPNRIDFLSSVPNKAIEYLSGGLPIATSLGGLLGRLIDEKGLGFRYREGDPAELARRLAALKDQPQARRTMSDLALKCFEEEFSAERVYSGMVDWLEEIAR